MPKTCLKFEKNKSTPKTPKTPKTPVLLSQPSKLVIQDESTTELSEADIVLETIEHKKLSRRTLEIQNRLDDINGRIKKTLESYDLVEKLAADVQGADVEFVNDMDELLAIATDAIKKRKYMKEVSVFIVGFDQACEERLKILEHLGDFFTAQAKFAIEMDEMETSELSPVSDTIVEALSFTETSISKLDTLNKDIIDAVESAVTTRERTRGNLKLKKQLDKAKEDIQALSEKLLGAEGELQAKSEEITNLNEELKEKSKSVAHLMKMLQEAEDKLTEMDSIKNQLAEQSKEMQILEKNNELLNEEINKMEEDKIRIKEELESVIMVKQDTIESLEEQVKCLEEEHAAAIKALNEQHEIAMEDMKLKLEEEFAAMNASFTGKIDELTKELEEEKIRRKEFEEKASSLSEELDAIKNRPMLTEDDIGPPFDLRDEESWANVPEDEVKARFAQYRKLAIAHISSLEERVAKLSELEAEVDQKLAEMERKWQAERQLLIDQADLAEQHVKEAEQEAEAAMFQLETFVGDIEKLHQMRDYLKLEVKHFRRLDDDMQEQYLKTLSTSAQDALKSQLNHAPDEVHFAVQTEDLIEEAKRNLSGLKSGSRKSQRSIEAQMRADPLLSEYLRSYDFVHDFKESIINLFSDKGATTIQNILEEVGKIDFNRDGNLVQQIAEMQQQLIIVLSEILAVLMRILFQDEYEFKQLKFVERHLPDLMPRALLAEIDANLLMGGTNLQALRKQYEELKTEFDLKLQDYVDKLKEAESENSSYKSTLKELLEKMEILEAKVAEFEAQRSSILFTRLDAERNMKNLKKALHYDKITPEEFEQATDLIDKYTSLPQKGLAVLVKKYVAFSAMKLVEENMRRATNKEGADIQLINNLETFQKKRMDTYNFITNHVSQERQDLAQNITESFEKLEEECGIFLIKPMFSYRAKLKERNYSQNVAQPTIEKLLRKISRRENISSRVKDAQYVPHPTFASLSTIMPSGESGIVGSEMVGAGYTPIEKPVPTWNKFLSVSPKQDVSQGSDRRALITTSKLQELDVGRRLFDQTNVCTPTLKISAADGTFFAQRSYITIDRTPSHTTNSTIEKEKHLNETSNRLPPLKT